MKNIIILAIIGLMVSCGNCENKNLEKGYCEEGYRVIVVDSCEYIEKSWNNMGYAAHKGNCRFCEKRRKSNQ